MLPAGDTVTWLESTLGSAYNLESNSAVAGTNIGLITYDIAVHDVDAGGDISLDADTHRECVLIKSGTPGEPPVIPEPPELPQTGPEIVFLVFAALLLGFGFFQIRKRA
jgi:LPXTG-motif cell wall-anchored protein